MNNSHHWRGPEPPNVAELSLDGSSSLSSQQSVDSLLQPSLESLAQEGRWNALVDLVQESSTEEWGRILWENRRQAPQSTPLHVALAYRAPLEVVDSIIEILQSTHGVRNPQSWQDEEGYTTLHVAAETGCQEEVVQRLVALDKDSATPTTPVWKKRNRQGQTALHVACVTPVQCGAMEKWHKCRVIAVLWQFAPTDATSLRDVYGQTAWDYLQRQQPHLTRALQEDLKLREERNHSQTKDDDDIEPESIILLQEDDKSLLWAQGADTPGATMIPTFVTLPQTDATVWSMSSLPFTDDSSCNDGNSVAEMDPRFDFCSHRTYASPRTIPTKPARRTPTNWVSEVTAWSCSCFKL